MNNLIKKIFFLIFISTLFSYIPPTVTGFVHDNNGEAINNVSISSELDQTYSDENGEFILLYKNKDTNISFERIGYEKIIVKANYFYSVNTLC